MPVKCALVHIVYAYWVLCIDKLVFVLHKLPGSITEASITGRLTKALQSLVFVLFQTQKIEGENWVIGSRITLLPCKGG